MRRLLKEGGEQPLGGQGTLAILSVNVNEVYLNSKNKKAYQRLF
jgi:hypothetical protein